MSQRKIADIVGCDQKTVSKVIGEEKPPMAEIPQEETLEVEGVQNKRSVKTEHPEDQEVEGESNERSVKMTQEETLEVEGEGTQKSSTVIPAYPEEEDTTSVFTHCTSVEPVANPWVCLTI
jgi:hypothetical protein